MALVMGYIVVLVVQCELFTMYSLLCCFSQ